MLNVEAYLKRTRPGSSGWTKELKELVKLVSDYSKSVSSIYSLTFNTI